MFLKPNQKGTIEGTSNHSQQYALIVIVALLLIGSMKEIGFSVPSFLFGLTAPHLDDQHTYMQSIKHGIYLLTDFQIDHPESIVSSLFYSGKGKEIASQQLAQVKGYFEQDENTYVTKEQVDSEESEGEKVAHSQKIEAPELPDLSDLNDVYTHYFAASGTMDFGLDMLEGWDFGELAKRKLSLDETTDGPQVLIFHTHAREEYIGGKTVVDVGEALKHQLEDQYGVKVLHVKDEFYEKSNHTKYPTKVEYEIMEPAIESVLAENPSISVVMDIHRDGVSSPDVHLVTDLQGKRTAKIMFVNGLCLNRNLEGQIEQKEGLPNPYVADNLAFSLQSQITMNTLYPGLSRKIFLNEWRYSTHMRPQSLLIEWGADTNTWEEAQNAVEPVAKVLMTVLGRD